MSLSAKTNFQGIYTKETKKGKAFIARYTINKKTKTQIIGYEKNGLTEYDAYKTRLALITSSQLINATKIENNLEFAIPNLFKQFITNQEPLLAKNTRDNYRSIYTQYILKDFENKDIRNISTNDLQNYINKVLLYRRPATVEKIISSLRKFYKYLQDNGIYKFNPATTLLLPKYDNKKYFSMPKKDVRRIIAYISNLDSLQYRCLYFILLHGRRINEALSLTWENIDFYQKSYNLDYSKTKTRKNQYYFLEDFQISELKKMKTASPNSKYVFENKKTKKPITYTSFFRIHKKLRIELNLPSFTIHSIRHMVGFLVVNNGFSLEITAKILGHSNIASTQRYAVLEMNKAKNAYKNISQQYFTTQSPRLT